MFTIVVTGSDRSVSRFTFDVDEVTLGRVAGNDVVIPGRNVSKRHARLVRRDNRFILVDLKSTNGTYVNGRKLTAPIIVTATDKIYIGEYSLGLAFDPDITKVFPLSPFIARDKIEADLLRAITETEETEHTREVYADWLEQHDYPREAEFLRLQQALVATAAQDPSVEPKRARLRELADTVDFRWRVRVGRPRIERCTFAFRCPKEWGSLAPTDREDQRHCGSCQKTVHYCTSVPEARGHAAKGECVALDLRAQRWSFDVDPPYMSNLCPNCRADLGSFSGDECPRCGDSLDNGMTVGMMG